MTAYRQTMTKALQEMYLSEDNVDLMRKAADGAMQTIKMKDGKLKMDMFTASAIMQVFDKVNPANQKKMTVMINKGTKAGMLKLQSFAMKQVKSEYGEEEELDEARQLKNPKKEVLVVKSGKVIVINKKDAKEYLNKGWELAEEVDLDEAKPEFEVKYAKSKKGPFKVTKFMTLDQAKEFLVRDFGILVLIVFLLF